MYKSKSQRIFTLAILVGSILTSCTSKNAEEALSAMNPVAPPTSEVKSPIAPIQTEPPVALVPDPQSDPEDSEEPTQPASKPAETADAAVQVPVTVGLAEVQIPAMEEETPLEETVLPVLTQDKPDQDSTSGTLLTEAMNLPPISESNLEIVGLPPSLPTPEPASNPESEPSASSPPLPLPAPVATTVTSTEEPPSVVPTLETLLSPEPIFSPVSESPTTTTTLVDNQESDSNPVQNVSDLPEENKTTESQKPEEEGKNSDREVASTPPPQSESNSGSNSNSGSHSGTNSGENNSGEGSDKEPVQEIVIKAECKGKKTVVVVLTDSRKIKSEKISAKCVKDSVALKLTVKKKDIPYIRIETTAM